MIDMGKAAELFGRIEQAADAHGDEACSTEVQCGDLLEVLRTALDLMTVAQLEALAGSDAVSDLLLWLPERDTVVEGVVECGPYAPEADPLTWDPQ